MQERRQQVRVQRLGMGVTATGVAVMIALAAALAGYLPRELFQLFVLILLLLWFTILGGYYSGLRAKLRRTNEELTVALRNSEVLATTDALTGCSNRRQALVELEVAAERLRRMVEAMAVPALPEGRRITASIGVAEHRPDEPVERTLERADQALYRAKQGGRIRVEAEACPSARMRWR